MPGAEDEDPDLVELEVPLQVFNCFRVLRQLLVDQSHVIKRLALLLGPTRGPGDVHQLLQAAKCTQQVTLALQLGRLLHVHVDEVHVRL